MFAVPGFTCVSCECETLSLTLREHHTFRMFGGKLLRATVLLRSKILYVTRGCLELHDEIHNLQCLYNINPLMSNHSRERINWGREGIYRGT
jgi:hypothetical protein